MNLDSDHTLAPFHGEPVCRWAERTMPLGTPISEILKKYLSYNMACVNQNYRLVGKYRLD